MNQETQLSEIPQPKVDPILKNLKEMDPETPVQSLMRLARIHGPVFRFSLPSRSFLVVSSQELVNELSDESRFDKKVHAPLEKIRDFAGDGLFTAYTGEPNWEKAHRILVPAFGPASIRNMFDQMLDIAEQMLLRWERFGEEASIDVPDNMTRLTLDTIALCAFDYRFNSFYQNEMHPFVNAMVSALDESGKQSRRLPLQNKLMFLTQRQYGQDIEYMHQIARQLIDQRREHPKNDAAKDLLSLMLSGRDPVTGEGLSDQNIIYQMVTFLIAGHETTSGLLSFTLYELLKNPEVMNKAKAEVDQILGNEKPRFEHMAKMPYLDQVLKESLRIWPTAPAIGFQPYQDTVLAGKYPMKKDEAALVLLPSLHRDPKVWKGDVEQFDPERFTPENFDQLPPNAWKPFGNGQRACIGRPFAMQEAQLVLAMILQRFDLMESDPGYQLKVKETLTLKPENFRIRIRKRGDYQPSSQSFGISNTRSLKQNQPKPAVKGHGTPLLVLYGSNSGSAESFAQRIASDAQSQGYKSELGVLDDYVGKLPTTGAMAIVTASYEGKPTDNARQFVAWLDALGNEDLKEVKYTVFGCGNRDWSRTYQAIPAHIDQRLQETGAERILERGEADARGDFFGDFDLWYDRFWPALDQTFGQETPQHSLRERFSVELVEDNRPQILRQSGMKKGRVILNQELVNMDQPHARSKRHIEIALPDGMTYRAGDYLAVLPTNHQQVVDRVLRRFALDRNSQVVIHKAEQTETTLPTGYPVSAFDLLTNYVELSQPATRKQVAEMAARTQCPPEKIKLEPLQEKDLYQKEVLDKHLSVLDLLERFPACEITFSQFLEMVPPMKARQYSISSSPLWNDKHCTLTVAVVQGEAWSGLGVYRGVASNHLASAQPGESISVMVKSSHSAFHLPANLEKPVIMICAGTGLAPFHGFLQERAKQKESGQKMGEAWLFFGCDHPDKDFLYKEELLEWERQGVVNIRTAFSGLSGSEKYVQDQLWQNRIDVERLFRNDAKIYVCGDGRRMAPAVRDTLIRVYQEATATSEREANNWADELEKNTTRYVTDVFS